MSHNTFSSFRKILALGGFAGAALVAQACIVAPSGSEDTGVSDEALVVAGGKCTNPLQCAAGLTCVHDPRWLNGPVGNSACEAATCNNGTKDGAETGVDCGGSCAPCQMKFASAVKFGGTAFDNARDIVSLTDGSAIVAGVFTGSINLGGATLDSLGGTQDIFLARFNAAGAHVWSIRLGSATNEGDFDIGIALNSTKSQVVLATNFAGTIDFGGGVTVTGNGTSYDALLATFSTTDGSIVWAKSFGGTGLDRFEDVSLDTANNIYAVGATDGTASFGGANLVSAGDDDIVVAKYTAAGAPVWSKRFGSTGKDFARAISVDRDNFPHVVGQYAGTVAFNAVSLTSAGSTDGFIVKLNNMGTTTAWARSLGGTSNDLANDVGVDALRRAVVGGFFKTTMTVLGNSVSVAAGSADTTDGYVAGFNKDGTFRFLNSIGSTGQDSVESVSADLVNNNIAVGGRFTGTVTPFYPDGTAATAVGLNDGFVARVHPTTGAFTQLAPLGGSSTDGAMAVAIGKDRLQVFGIFAATSTFGAAGSLSSAGAQDVFFARLGF